MRRYPHDPVESVFRQNLDAASRRMTPNELLTPELLDGKNERFLALNAKAGLECAARAYALEQDESGVLGALRESSRSFRKLLERGLPLSLTELSHQLSLASILDDAEFVQRLTGLPRDRYMLPDMVYPESMYLVTECQADIAANRIESAARRLDAARMAIQDNKVLRSVREELEPLLHLERAIIERDQESFDAALQSRHQSHARKYSNPRLQNMAEGALDIQGLGLVQLGIWRGLVPHTESVYLPVNLLRTR